MRSLLIRAVALSAVCAAFVGFGPGSSAAAQTTHIINTANFQFTPANITIDVGDTVRWVWIDGMHQVAEGLGPTPLPEAAFNQPLTVATPLLEVTFDTQFLFDNPRTSNLYNFYCVPHFAFNMKGTVSVTSPWVDGGFALAGVAGEPQLIGTGTLEAGTSATLQLSSAAPNATVGLFVSFTSTPVPFKGGTLCTIPLASMTIFPIGPSGSVVLPGAIPAGIPSGAQIFWQYAIQDAAAVAGVALSNCLVSVFP